MVPEGVTRSQRSCFFMCRIGKEWNVMWKWAKVYIFELLLVFAVVAFNAEKSNEENYLSRTRFSKQL